MSQKIKPGRTDNRGGGRPKSSEKIMFSYRVEPEHKETLTEIAIYLNEKSKKS